MRHELSLFRQEKQLKVLKRDSRNASDGGGISSDSQLKDVV